MNHVPFEVPRAGLLAALFLFCAAWLVSPPALAETCFEATIDGAQAGTGSPGTGVGKFVLNDSETALTYKITFQGLLAAETASHIHSDDEGGAALKNTGLGTPKIGNWLTSDAVPLTPARVASLKAGRLYVNIHSTMFPGGEIAGQLLVVPCQEQCFRAPINGAGAGTGSPGTGLAWAALNHTETELAYWVDFSGLLAPETAAHIHSHAEGGGVVHPLSAGSPKAGVWRFTDTPALTAQRVNDLKAGRLYVNIHSTMFPGGEIAGDLIAGVCETRCFEASLDGAQAGTTSLATGQGSFHLSHARNRFDYFVTLNDVLPQTAAHIHNHNEGDAIVNDIGTGTTKLGDWDSDDAPALSIVRVADLMAGAMYVNVHTPSFPNGEIRGQINPLVCSPTDVNDTPKLRTKLQQNVPNPFNPTTTIEFTLASPMRVSLDVYDVAGRLVTKLLDGPAAGRRVVTWNGLDDAGRPVNSGVYFYRLVAGSVIETRKMLLLK